MARRHCQLRVCDPKVFLLLPATPLAHRHPRILRTIPVDHTLFCFTYPDLHHRLLRNCFASSSCSPFGPGFSLSASSALTLVTPSHSTRGAKAPSSFTVLNARPSILGPRLDLIISISVLEVSLGSATKAHAAR